MPRPSEPAGRIDAIDAARGISILLIVLLHARLVLAGVGIESDVVSRIDEVAGFARVPLFFAASGLFAARWASAPWGELWRRRLLPLAWVFLIWQPVVLTYKLAESWLVRGTLAETGAWQVTQFFLSPVRPVGELWFLWALCVFLVVLRATSRLPRMLVVGAAAAVSYSWTAFVAPVLPSAFEYYAGAAPGAVAKYFVFFAAAALFARPALALARIAPVWAAAGFVGVWIALAVLALDSDVELRWVRFALSASGAIAGVALGRVLAVLAPLRSLGRQTLPVYVAHLALLVSIAIVLQATGLSGPAQLLPTAVTVLAAGAAVAASLLLHRALTRTRGGRLLYAPPPRLTAERPLSRAGARSRVGRAGRS